jgi:hypothetical protein
MIKRRSDQGTTSLDRTKKASMALDELVWSLQGLKIEQIKEAADLLRISVEQSGHTSAVAKGYQSIDPNKHFLIGILPRLFQDHLLFPQNEDIADFAGTALGLQMSRAEKRSRYEIIGKVVCETDQLDELRLTTLVKALEKLVGNKEKLAQMAEKKRAGSFSWNETIQDLLKL